MTRVVHKGIDDADSADTSQQAKSQRLQLPISTGLEAYGVPYLFPALSTAHPS
jgi:hypothetical protein